MQLYGAIINLTFTLEALCSVEVVARIIKYARMRHAVSLFERNKYVHRETTFPDQYAKQ
jgi:hypothetical protein